MVFENHLTDEDMERAAKLEPRPVDLTAAYMSQMNAIEAFWVDIVHKAFHKNSSMLIRHLAIATLGDRAMGHSRIVPKLNSLVYQQTITSAERSVIELWLDIWLIHKDVFADGPDRLFAFGEHQKLGGAKRTVRFFAEHPELDETPSAAEPHRDFLAREGQRIEATTNSLWGKPSDHWTGMKLHERAKAVSPVAQLRVAHGYDMRNFATHTGVAGVMNVGPTTTELMFGQSISNIADCMIDILRIVGAEFEMSKTVTEYDHIVEYLVNLHSYCFCDIVLQSQGEPQRLFFRSGPWAVRNVK